jgi:TetR/AcrR family tetracycline transcriptional repressor
MRDRRPPRHARASAPRTRHAPESIDERRHLIVRAALDLLDEHGFEAMSLRHLARHLGMHAPGLYWYFESKQELTDLMAKAILEDGLSSVGPLAPNQTWEEWLLELAVTARRALLSRRDGARVVAGAYLLRTNTMSPILETALEILESAGFDRLAALGATMTLLRYATGIALDEQASPLGEHPTRAGGKRLHELPVPQVDATRWPRTADAFQRAFTGTIRDREAIFRWGVTLIVRGLAASVSERGRPRSS